MPAQENATTGPVRIRAVVKVLIAVSVGLQLVVTTRVLCPPQSLRALAWLRIGCPPRFWPFIDYPMFSAPHVPGETLAWVDAQSTTASGAIASSSAREVQRESPQESFDQAFARMERTMRAELEPGLAERALHLVFVRHQLVLTKHGFVPPCPDCPEPAR
jgi:hypothetical protein